jgi:hypothetical protein
MGEAAIFAALCAENEERCQPRLDTAEVQTIAASVARYNPDPVASNEESPAPSLPTIDIANLQFREKVSLALEAMQEANRRDQQPRFFEQHGILVRLRFGEDTTPKVEPLTADSLRGELARIADWLRTSDNGAKPIDPPKEIARDILALTAWRLPRLRRIATTPYFAHSRRLIVTPGYEATEAVMLCPPAGLTLPPVPSEPTTEDLERAKALLLDELLGDFPFESGADRAHAICALLYPLVRDLIDAPPPLHSIDAPTPGTGKGLLASVLVRVSTGTSAPVISEKSDNDELRKTITALLMEGRSIVVIDNVRRRVSQSSLAAFLTADVWCDRVLGVSRTVALPNRTLSIVTGNNTAMTDEMVRRTIRVRLDARIEDPSKRSDFRHSPLDDFVDANRGELLWAALTLVSNWIARGAKPFRDRTLGSFEQWARVMGGILYEAGIAGFLEDDHLRRTRRQADPESAAWISFFEAWWQAHGGRAVRSSELIDLAAEMIPKVVGEGSPRSQETRLGAQLMSKRGRVFGGLLLEDAEIIDAQSRRRQAWRLIQIDSELSDQSRSGGTGGMGGQVAALRIPDFDEETKKASGANGSPHSLGDHKGPIPPVPPRPLTEVRPEASRPRTQRSDLFGELDDLLRDDR